MSAILIEAITLTLLVALLIFFTCKCVFILLHKKIKNQPQPQSQNLQHMVNFITLYIFVIVLFIILNNL